MAGALDLWYTFQFLKRLVTPFEKWKAYERGIIDKEGNIIKDYDDRDYDDKHALGKFDLLVLRLKRLLGKLPAGKTKIASYAAALWLVKEHQEKGVDLEEFNEEALNKYIIIAEELDAERLLNEQMSVGAGVVDGIGVGDKGEPGFTKQAMDAHKKRNKKALKHFRKVWGDINR